MRILAVDNEEAYLRAIEVMLGAEKFNVYGIDSADEAIDLGQAVRLRFDCAQPARAGRRDPRAAYREGSHAILVISRNGEIDVMVRTLDAGADDYMTKPFHKDELVARIHALVRRSKGHAESVVTVGDIAVNLAPKRQRWRASRLSDRQGIPDDGVARAAQGRDAQQGTVPQSRLWRHGRTRTENHRRVRVQAAQEADVPGMTTLAPRLMSGSEAAAYCGVTPATWSKWVADGRVAQAARRHSPMGPQGYRPGARQGVRNCCTVHRARQPRGGGRLGA
jgi:DNA-binding NarL/FixJ family response regulator